jgi:hypothetical protein
MEQSYDACNIEGGNSIHNKKYSISILIDVIGTGSHARRKSIINTKLADETIFDSLRIMFRNRFRTITEELQSDIQVAIVTHLSIITNTLDIVRNENIAIESERDPEFRRRVERKVETVKREIRRIQEVIR